MKTALLINRDNFEKYSAWQTPGAASAKWELQHFGNGEPDVEKVIASQADVLVVDAIMKIGPEIIEKMPGLKLIHSQGVAYNAIDCARAREAGIYVCNCAGVNAAPVAEHAILLILALLKSFRWGEDMAYAGKQMDAKMACFKDGQPELGGMTVGIIGLGAIGKSLASMLKPFGCKINYYTRSGDCGAEGMAYMPLDEIYATSDIVSLHVPVTADTTNMINGESLKKFKRGAILINTARGELMDHSAVVEALKSGQLGGLGADTLAPEPFLLDNPVLRDIPEELRRRVAISPHVAGITAGTFIRAYERVRANIEAVGNGQRPECVVNGL
ncbi:MAG: 2-hydroxyacid dehydrogenase [Oscillospiraceae bacterium]|nr:2-hydroxyacid dehydrogenase [Oscillospiraceae bacterium]